MTFRSYVNSKGEKVEVSKDHLDVAVQIKIELQKSSPSYRCSWAKHKKLMEKEGYDNSDKNENYRVLVKSHQKNIGELPEKEKYAEIVSSKKLESIKEAVGELYYTKREVQLQTQNLGKIKRSIVDKSLLIQDIVDSFKGLEIRESSVKEVKDINRDREMLVLPSDWHIGYLDEHFSLDIAYSRIDEYIEGIVHYAKTFNINVFNVVHMGDMVENLYMHKNTQSFNAEFNFSEQIVKATELMFYMIESLSEFGKVIYRGSVRGNHGRMSNKKETVEKDSAEYIIHESIKSIISRVKNPNIIVDDSGYDVERAMFNIKEKSIKVTHGDRDSQNDRNIVSKHISFENKLIDLVCMGHFHNFKVTTENHNRMVYQSGCLQGATEFGKTLKFDSPASQGIIVIGENEVIPINISFKR